MKEVTVLDFSRKNINRFLLQIVLFLIKIIPLGFLKMEVLFLLTLLVKQQALNSKSIHTLSLKAH